MSKQDVVQVVQDLIDQNQPIDYQIVMSNGDARQEGTWWYVEVHPTDPNLLASEYTRRLEDIENQLRRSYGIDVLLVPTLEE